MNSAANDNPDVQKRRTSRIVQAVPLTVAGVDALGRPFQERTSTLIINCHGCRYQSKHYVLKNMWLTLEVPHPDADHEPRSVRARVMWIRRPHTVRELFQVGVELEVPGNLWGIAFPPPDWFPFPDGLSELNEMVDMNRPPKFNVEDQAARAETTLPEGNVRDISTAGSGDPSWLLARQMTHLVNEAKQQLQSAIRESAALAVAEEARPLVAALRAQIQETARHSVDEATEQASHAVQEQATQASKDELQQLREYWSRQVAENIEQATQTLEAHIAEVEQTRRTGFTQDLEAESSRAVENLRGVTHNFQIRLSEAQKKLDRLALQAETTAAPAMQKIEERLRIHSEEARAQFTEFERAARQWNEQINSAAAAAQEGWQGHLEAAMQTAETRWNERVETSLEDGVRQAADRLMRRTQETSEQMDRELGMRLAAMRQAFSDASAEAEQRMAGLRELFDGQSSRTQAILSQVQQATLTLETQTQQIEALRQNALHEMERTGTALMDAQTQELSRRTELALAHWTEGLQPSLEEAGKQVVARLGADLEKNFGAHFDRAGQTLGQLENGRRSTEEALYAHRDAVGKVSDQAVQSTLTHLQDAVGRLEHDFEESSRTVATKWVADIEAKATETTHTTFESLFKTAEWYEKKVQTQMQTTLEKGLAQAGDSLREKAGEISRLFAAEMDHYSRSYVEHTNGQIEESVREAVGGVRMQSTEISNAMSSTISQQAHDHAERALAQFHKDAATALSQISSHLDLLTKQARSKLDAYALQSQEGYRAALVQEAQQAARLARQNLLAQAEFAKEDVRAEGQKYTTQMQETLGSISNQAIDTYRKRFESASDTWLLTTVSKLSQHSAEQLDAIAKAAEIRLRETCNQVFANVGESLRRRLLDLSIQSSAQPTPPPNWPPDQK